MYIRQTKTRHASQNGKDYYTFRLVESKRIDNKVKQRTLLNLGTDFSLPKDQWAELCIRIQQLLDAEAALFEVPAEIEQLAQSIYSQILARQGDININEQKTESDFQEIDVNSLQQIQPKTVGAEHVALEALKELQLPEILTEAGFNKRQSNQAIANIIGRMCKPMSEYSTHTWLQEHSALGELLDYDFQKMSLMQLYRSSDRLLKKKDFIEQKLFTQIQDLFQLTPTVALYDLTNTYMEGVAQDNPKAKRGRSKEKRSDCPLITLGLAIDPSGFVRNSKVFEGNISEATSLAKIIAQFKPPEGALIIMDAGIATEENLQWLHEKKFNYLVVSRKQDKTMNQQNAMEIEAASGHKILLERQQGNVDHEIELACWSQPRAAKETSMISNARESYESELNKLNEGLTKPRNTKKRDAINRRIGRLNQRYSKVSSSYIIDLKLSEDQDIVTALTWKYEPKENSKHQQPGVYKLRTTMKDWNDEKLWRTYTMLTDLESVFRCLKSELGMRPVYHQSEDRCDGHLFITVLAYQGVQLIRKKLREAGNIQSWEELRKTLNTQIRITATFNKKDGRSLHVRQASKESEKVQQIYNQLGICSNPGGIKKLII